MKKNNKDIFDRIMDLKIFEFFLPLYNKYKEIILYLFFGGLTFVVSIASYAFFEYSLKLSPLIANIFSWILAVIFAYLTNRIWVFKNIAQDIKGILQEVVSFFSGRILTLVIEEIILYIGITLLEFNSIATKIIGQIVVIISNYFISKLLVFKTK